MAGIRSIHNIGMVVALGYAALLKKTIAWTVKKISRTMSIMSNWETSKNIVNDVVILRAKNVGTQQ